MPLMHGKTGADFRMCREYLGWSQRQVSYELGYSDDTGQTIKRWENPRSEWEPLEKGWEWVDRELEHHDAEVNRILDRVDDMKRKNHGRYPKEVTLLMFRDSDSRGDMRTDDRPPGAHNAVARDAWQFLNDEGVKVNFVWAIDYHPQDYPDAIW